MKTLLRYAGGKSRAVQQILSYIPEGVGSMCSPFFGGGSVEFALSDKGVKVHGYDAFDSLVNFWVHVFRDPSSLADAVEEYFPLSRDAFYYLQKTQNDLPDRQRAAAFYVLNRCSFSGTTLSGGMSPNHPRFTQSSIDRLRNFKQTGVTIECLDFRESIPKHKDSFLYLDPPYLIKSANLYGDRGNMHKGFDHKSLHELLTSRTGWVLSYNDCPEIREMYKSYEILEPSWNYGMGKEEKSKELLIVSKGEHV